MEDLNTISMGLAAAAAVLAMPKLISRVELSLAKHRSLAGHPRMSRRVASRLPDYSFEDDDFFRADDPSPEVLSRRKLAWQRLATAYQKKYPISVQQSAEVEHAISDMQFINQYRVPFQFRKKAGTDLKIASFVGSTAGATMTDLDGNVFYDLTGSFGVNVFGNDQYKAWIREGADLVQDLGPVLGSYHPVVAHNVKRLKDISGMDEVSFHMSGTEAVMQAVRLACYHTKRTHLVRFCGSYHGWWGDVQPGVGNPQQARSTYNLKDMDQDTLRVLRKRKDIACVLVNPLQALHPNRNAPGDSSLVDSSRHARFDRQAYTTWLKALREVCDEKGIALIFDEVFLGFRLAHGGAQEYFGVRADLVTYGKTLGGGLPVGVVCGRHQWMKRYQDDAPANICFARGTFNSHPYVMGAMHQFLNYIDQPEVRSVYATLEDVWNRRAHRLNAMLAEAALPVQVANLSSIWTVNYTVASRYNWMLQFYLRLEGLALSWVGTGRLIFPINATDEDFAEIARRFLLACDAMHRDGWWSGSAALTNKGIRRSILKEMATARWPALKSIL